MAVFNSKDTEEIATQVEEIALDELLNQGQNVIKPSFEELKAEAFNYLAITKSLANELSAFSGLLKKQQSFRRQNINYAEVDEYIKNKEKINAFLAGDIPRRLYEESFKFQNMLNNFLGQQVEMVFVIKGASGPELYRMNGEDLLKFDYSSSNKLVARYNTSMQALQQSCQRISLDDSKLRFSLPGLKNTYGEVLYRYNISRKFNNRIVLWKKQKIWQKMTVSAEGDINEAYASFVLLNKAHPSFMKNIEENVGDFMIEGVQWVDNISGLLKGDVTVNNIEFGIKSANASTLGLAQIQNIATQIVSDGFDPNQILKIKENMIAKGRQRNKLSEVLSNELNDLMAALKPKS